MDSGLGQAIDIRTDYLGVAVTAQSFGRQLIGHDNEDVWLMLGWTHTDLSDNDQKVQYIEQGLEPSYFAS